MVSTFQFSGDDSVFFWQWTCWRMRKSCCVPRNGKTNAFLQRYPSYLPFSVDFWGDNAETEVMLAVCLGIYGSVTLVLVVHRVGLVTLVKTWFRPLILWPKRPREKHVWPWSFFFGKAVRCGTMDSFDVGALTAETLVVFCVATAGKGGESAQDVGKWWLTFFLVMKSWLLMWFCRSKIYWFFWSKSYGFLRVLGSFSFKA